MIARPDFLNFNLPFAAAICFGVLAGALPVNGVLAAEYGYPAETTAIILVDPYNDFISEGGKIWGRIKLVAESVNLLPNLKKLVNTARAKGVRVFYAPHRRYREGDFENLALEIFRFQFTHSPAYRSWCEILGVEAAKIAAWRDIPPVPAQAFREEAPLSCLPA